ncbi:isoprenyl transferase [Tepidimicrobium xylanilyticum]|uniref:Isoprenyl transferase n=1 Tax=Tepidimicrobium xylanilyticum TaxID=1123352 RepID=A0A1H2YCC4_9FIRM|nr:isoprenyl transferase [Tepidimicrobium xylanilyticum]GMG97105.1 isoprenyl transferase [Tepidimicrobium xylanilyticum]SDX02873.1 undecaprenyl diphosphate synthase [Tepidimicrobium xylanilyticum]
MERNPVTELREKIDMDRLPSHIAIIMDGNGRWAKKRLLPRTAGHREGMKRVIDIVQVASELNIKYLSLYAFSTENWKRPKEEIDGLMKLLVEYIRIELDRIHRNNIKIQTMGDLSKIPEFARKEIKRAIDTTQNNTKMVLNIGLNYGGRDEIIRGIKSLLEDIRMGKINIEEVDEGSFKNYLYTKDIPDPDLLIRPSGELRISNFMLYQIAYTEFWFSDILWPDFKEEHLYMAIIDYQRRNRRFGGI